jgi:hypothetical protein
MNKSRIIALAALLFAACDMSTTDAAAPVAELQSDAGVGAMPDVKKDPEKGKPVVMKDPVATPPETGTGGAQAGEGGQGGQGGEAAPDALPAAPDAMPGTGGQTGAADAGAADGGTPPVVMVDADPPAHVVYPGCENGVQFTGSCGVADLGVPGYFRWQRKDGSRCATCATGSKAAPEPASGCTKASPPGSYTADYHDVSRILCVASCDECAY